MTEQTVVREMLTQESCWLPSSQGGETYRMLHGSFGIKPWIRAGDAAVPESAAAAVDGSTDAAVDGSAAAAVTGPAVKDEENEAGTDFNAAMHGEKNPKHNILDDDEGEDEVEDNGNVEEDGKAKIEEYQMVIDEAVKDEVEGDVDLTEEVDKHFDQVMKTFNEARRTGDPLRYDREVTQGICDFKKARGRCRELRNIDRYSVEKMEEKVKKETRIFSTSALQKLKERKHKRPPEEKKHQEQEEEEDNPEEEEEGDKEVNSHKEEEGSEESIEEEERGPEKPTQNSVAMVCFTRDKEGEVFGAETETSSDLERKGEKHKAPDEEKGPVKTLDDTIAMASFTKGQRGRSVWR